MPYETSNLNRRTFLRQASIVALTLPALQTGILTSCAQAAKSEFQDTPLGKESAGTSWQVVIVNDKEAGEPLIVTGTVFLPDGETPMARVNLHVHQTDATGHYSTQGGDNRNTRINGSMRTNAEGRYEFRTIKPAAYPGGRIPAHIHVSLSGPGYREYWTDDFLFDDDPLVTDELRQSTKGKGTFSHILKLERGSDGVLRGHRDFKLERCSRNCTNR